MLADSGILHAFSPGDTAIANPILVFGYGIYYCCGARQSLSVLRVVLFVQNQFLEKGIGAGVIFATIEDNPRVVTANFFPVGDSAGIDSF